VRARSWVFLIMAALLGVGGLPATSEPANSARVVRVSLFFPKGGAGTGCNRVLPATRMVVAPAVLRGAMVELLRGPTASEHSRGYGGWFSTKTAGMLRSVRIDGGVAYIDFRDLRRVIPNASSSCGSALLLAQLDRTATQFHTVRRAIYSIGGSRRAFYEWLQYSVPHATS
jgi:hypothetical protein